ncbi:hypothetical protein AVEN_92800-1 [Araneus ventricosus]|uniref:Uncharacterized protein n=1 Tax=Araneus ventricosus TaxID=182803 RepID=A0A4Y2T4J1_ARAVE|nr:hypothetical protein AVEN_92800-1 [Araneus ventricosus]
MYSIDIDRHLSFRLISRFWRPKLGMMLKGSTESLRVNIKNSVTSQVKPIKSYESPASFSLISICGLRLLSECLLSSFVASVECGGSVYFQGCTLVEPKSS